MQSIDFESDAGYIHYKTEIIHRKMGFYNTKGFYKYLTIVCCDFQDTLLHMADSQGTVFLPTKIAADTA